MASCGCNGMSQALAPRSPCGGSGVNAGSCHFPPPPAPRRYCAPAPFNASGNGDSFGGYFFIGRAYGQSVPYHN